MAAHQPWLRTPVCFACRIPHRIDFPRGVRNVSKVDGQIRVNATRLNSQSEDDISLGFAGSAAAVGRHDGMG